MRVQGHCRNNQKKKNRKDSESRQLRFHVPAHVRQLRSLDKFLKRNRSIIREDDAFAGSVEKARKKERKNRRGGRWQGEDGKGRKNFLHSEISRFVGPLWKFTPDCDTVRGRKERKTIEWKKKNNFPSYLFLVHR